MFALWGRTVYRYRYIVIGVMVALCLGGGVFGASLGKHVTQSGFYDDGSQSVKASKLADDVYGRDRTSHVVGILTPPPGKKADDPQWDKQMVDEINAFASAHPDQVLGWVSWLRAPDSPKPEVQKMITSDKKDVFFSMPLKGDNDDVILKNYQAIAPDLQKLNGGHVELAGLQPIASELTGTIAKDQERAEVLALPLVAIVLFFVFGGVVAAFLPVMVGGLSILGALGILRFISLFGPVHFFAQPVVTLIGLGIAIDYGLFVVSRFREEIAEGYDTEAAVRRTVMTAGRTVFFSAVIIVASAAGLLLFPQGFLKSITYAVIASVMLSAILSTTLLPAVLGVLGANVDALGVRTLLRVPFFRNWKPTNWWLNFLADKTQKTKTREEVERGFWGRLVNRVMKRPILFALPIVIVMIVLIIPLGKLSLGGISEKYLPPNNSVRVAQEHFNELFPTFRTEQLMLVIQNANDQQVDEITSKAAQISGFTDSTWAPRDANNEGNKDPSVKVFHNGLADPNAAASKIAELRNIQAPKGVTISVGGTPALEQDSIHSLFDKLPLMVVILITTTTLLMFLAFGSLVLPIKAALMSALTLFSTMGMLTWIFVEGHGEGVLNFTRTPLMAPMIGLIIAVVYGLSTDYEVFLVSRMIEARERGMSTAEAIRIGTATTGRLITAAALILVVVAGAFAFSDLVMLKYLAFGLITALILDATIIRMFLVPAIMKLLGDDCWWAPRWMKRLQTRIGLGEIHLPDERKRPAVREPEEALVSAGAPALPRRPRDPTHPGAEGATRPGAMRPASPQPRPAQSPSGAGTTRMPQAGQKPAESEPTTTRLTVAAKNAARAVINNAAAITQRTQRPASPPPAASPPAAPPAAPPPAAPQRRDREIESWLGELRGTSTPAQSDATEAIPTAPKTTQPEQDSTEKLPQQRPPDEERRRGGGVSAQDLLRREGRL